MHESRRTEHTRDWCRMPDDPFTGRFQYTMDCPSCHERLAEELRRFESRKTP